MENGAGTKFVKSQNGHVSLTMKEKWDKGWDAPLVRFTQWCEARQGKVIVDETAALAASEVRKQYNELDYDVGLVLKDADLISSAFERTVHCTTNTDQSVMFYSPASRGTLGGYGQHGASLYLISGSEIDQYAPDLRAAAIARAKDAEKARAIYVQKNKERTEAAQALSKNNEDTTRSSIAAMKPGSRILCIARINPRAPGSEPFYCNNLPSIVDPEKLVLAGWNVVSKERDSMNIRMILSR